MDGFRFWIVDGRKIIRSQERDEKIIEAYTSGKTLHEVGQAFGVTRERIRQILKRNGIVKEQGGSAIRMFLKTPDIIAKEKDRLNRKEARVFRLWGMSKDELDAHISRYGNTNRRGSPMHRFTEQKRNARRAERGIKWNISFKDWWKVWEDSGKWKLRGRGKGYCMARYGDSGGYEIGNVYICTVGQNSSDQYLVRKHHWRSDYDPQKDKVAKS